MSNDVHGFPAGEGGMCRQSKLNNMWCPNKREVVFTKKMSLEGGGTRQLKACCMWA
jgi:hypothetical protein